MAIAERELSRRELTAPVQKAEADFEPQPYRWTREQFYQIGDMGLFEGRRAILIEGEILAIPAMGDLHRNTLTLASDVLREIFGAGFFVSAQCPFDVGQATDPEPDIAIISGSVFDYAGRGLTEAALIVEVSDSTLPYDRGKKANLYAMAGVTDYWVLNIDRKPGQLEVYRQPQPDEAQPYGYGYTEVKTYQKGEVVQPLNAPNPVAVSMLLP